MRTRVLSLWVALVLGTIALPAVAVTVTISPTSAAVQVGFDRKFIPTVTGATDLTVQWYVNGILGGNNTIGTIDAVGTYRPPVGALPPSNPVTVKAVSNADPSATASATVYVIWPVPTITSVAPNPLPTGPFNITVFGTNFISGATVQWNGASIPTVYVSSSQLKATGTATVSGPIGVKVTNPGAGSVSGAFTVNVVSSLIVTVSPSASTILPGQTIHFSATVANTANQNVVWDTSAGTIDNSGFFTAPASPPAGGFLIVGATAVVDGVSRGTAMVAIQDPLAIHAGRFLEQSTFGPTPQLMAHVEQIGTDAFIDEQFATPESPWPDPNTATRSTAIDAFFNNQRNGADQLRQRVVYALSEVFVVSMNKNVNGNQIVPWLKILSKNAFGNYRNLLGDLTLDASMGFYLDMVNSVKPTGMGSGANENYPREIMQLMSIGLVQLNADGTPKLDPVTNQPIPSYTQTDVQQLARAFTGWTYNDSSNAPTAPYQRGAYYPGPMVPVPSYHDTTQKTVLGKIIPANQSPKQDVDAALDIIYKHPNVGPFIATRLIRALVTSNPSPQYVQRVAAKFDNNGQGIRGDLTAVVRAILTDVEARNDNPPPNFGRLRTPVQHLIAMTRALGMPMNGASSINYLLQGMGEDELTAPSVFGHYSPMFRIPKVGLYGPEFQIYTATESVNRANFLYQFFFGGGGTLNPTLQPLANIAGDPVALTTAVDNMLLYGRMLPSTRNSIQQSLPQMYDNTQRTMSALYLTVMSGEYLVQH